MGILKNYECPSTGVSGEYWRISGITYERGLPRTIPVELTYGPRVMVRVALFLDKAARESGKAPILERSFLFTPDQFDDNLEAVEGAYTLLMTIPTFEEGVNDELSN